MFYVYFLCLISSLISASTPTTYFVVHGMGENIDYYLPDGEFYKSVEKTALTDTFTLLPDQNSNENTVTAHSWHTPSYQHEVGYELIKLILKTHGNKKEIEAPIKAIFAAITDPLQGFLAGAMTIQRILGAYGLAKRIIDEALYQDRNVVLIGTSFGGHISCGASRLISPELEQKPFNEIQLGFEALMRLAHQLQKVPVVIENILTQRSIYMWAPCRLVKKYFNKLRGTTRPNESEIYKTSIRALTDQLEDLIKEPALVWSLCAECIQQYKKEKLNEHQTDFPIEKLITVGMPAARGAFSFDPASVKSAYHLYSAGDATSFAASSAQRDNLPTDKSVNLRIVLADTGWCQTGHPTHMELCGRPSIGILAPLLHEQTINYPLCHNFENFTFKKDGIISITEDPLMYTYSQA